MNARAQQPRTGGFALVEVMLALVIGLAVLLLMAEALLADSGYARRLGRLLRERVVAQRALALIAGEVQQAELITRSSPTGDTKGCGLAGRGVRLHLQVPAGAIVYSLEANPSAIWRGTALMRCGPVYGVDGSLHAGTRESSVLIDAVAGNTLSIQDLSSGLLLQLERRFGDEDGTIDQLRVELLAAGAAVLVN